jgi:probable rRNA maturation factor
MKIEINNRTKSKLDLKLISQAINVFGRSRKISHKEISVAFVGDAEIKKLNRTYRSLNQATDVLAFAGEGDFFGEIIIDYNQIKRQAGRFGNSAKREMVFILVHGLLHLVGHDDETEKAREKMIKLGEEFVKKLKI